MRLQDFVVLEDRGVLALSGADARDFLQGLISNDVGDLTPDHAIYAALLTPQGKYLFDFLLAQHGDEIWLDGDRQRLPELRQRLTMYRLRSKVTIEDRSDRLAVLALPAAPTALPSERGAAKGWHGGVLAIDPRLPELGARAWLPRDEVADAMAELGLAPAPSDDYERARLELGVPGTDDLVVQKSLLLESGFEELAGVAFDKGCFVGQELTARTKHRALVRKRLLPVQVEGPLPAPGTPLMLGEREAGEMRGGRDGRGIALVRLEMLGDGMPTLSAGESRVTPSWPGWIARPAPTPAN
jgi:folate-binding protein YgfZ